jgi:hypothetical protein
MKTQKKTWIWLSIFAISMAALESAVVVYLRALFYGETVELFPLQPLSQHLLWVELCRELATILMLVSVGVLVGKNAWSRLGYFLAAFGIWDIFYYVFLFLFIQWPQSVLTWDILFLIPLPWFGPVLAPCLISLAFIGVGLITSHHEEKGAHLRIRIEEWTGMTLACLIMLYSFMEESIKMVFNGQLDPESPMLLREMAQFVPDQFSWGIFTVGFGMLLASIVLYYRRLRNSHLILY